MNEFEDHLSLLPLACLVHNGALFLVNVKCHVSTMDMQWPNAIVRMHQLIMTSLSLSCLCPAMYLKWLSGAQNKGFFTKQIYQAYYKALFMVRTSEYQNSHIWSVPMHACNGPIQNYSPIYTLLVWCHAWYSCWHYNATILIKLGFKVKVKAIIASIKSDKVLSHASEYTHSNVT